MIGYEQGKRYEFTRKTRDDFDEQDDTETVVAALLEPTWPQEAERECRTMLAEHGLPEDPDRWIKIRVDEHGTIERNDDGMVSEWRDDDDDTEELGWAYTRPRFIGEELRVDFDSPLGYASRIIDEILQGRTDITAGRLEAGLAHIFTGGALYRESEIAEWYANRHDQWRREREIAILIANREVERNPAQPIRDIVAAIKVGLHERGLKVPEDDDTIKRDWLRPAERAGQLRIPEAARRGGRPRKY